MKLAKLRQEIDNRNFITTWENGFPGDGWAKAKTEEIELMDNDGKMALFGADSWRKYSRNVSYPIKLRYLAGREDGQYWAVRVPSTVDSVGDAIAWIMPAAVKKAVESGKWVARQGDVYLVELKSGKDNLSELPENHHFSVVSRCRAVWHPQHKTVRIPPKVKAVKFIRQTQIAPQGRTYAD